MLCTWSNNLFRNAWVSYAAKPKGRECYRTICSSSASYIQLSSANAATFARILARTASSNSTKISIQMERKMWNVPPAGSLGALFLSLWWCFTASANRCLSSVSNQYAIPFSSAHKHKRTFILLHIPIPSLLLLVKRLHRRIPNLEFPILISYYDVWGVRFGLNV